MNGCHHTKAEAGTFVYLYLDHKTNYLLTLL
ncbi:hypothetical protein M080_7457, partial [Bacteroides fragilis str. 3397 T10]